MEKLSGVNTARFQVLINNSVIRNFKEGKGENGVELQVYYFLFAIIRHFNRSPLT